VVSLGVPLAVVFAGGLLFAVIRGHAPSWQLLADGLGGAMLVAIALRASARRQPARP
jgi:hypothetical protein